MSRQNVLTQFMDSKIQTKGQNEDPRRVAMYASFASRGLAIPFELADNEEELAKYADITLDDLPADSDEDEMTEAEMLELFGGNGDESD